MFVFSVRSRKFRLAVMIAVAAAAAVICFAVVRPSAGGDEPSSECETVDCSAETEEQRNAFIGSFGWKVKSGSQEVCEVLIPAEFDEVYRQYNEIQLEQGFDLRPYAGCRVKKWTYTVTNYEGYENSGCIRLNMLVYEGRVIGGDVCSVELGGFMHGFSKK